MCRAKPFSIYTIKLIVMKTSLKLLVIFFISMLFSTSVQAQFCDSLVPTLTVDLSASATQSWTSPSIQRDGSCCGSTAPDVCLEFVITLHPDASAILFDIASGAVPPGALFYQIDCGPITPVGAPICLNGAGPHNLTFCKPGNNQNSFTITSFSQPIIGPDITLNASCQGFIYAQYYNEPSVNWTSIAPGNVGDYDGVLSCSSGCDTTYITAPNSAPAFVDYLVCGMDAAGCNVTPVCDTIRVNFIAPVVVSLSNDTTVCPGVNNVVLNSTISGGSGPYSILWSTGEISNSIIVGPGVYSAQVTDSSGCFVATDTVVVSVFSAPIVNAGLDQVLCEGPMVTLTGAGATSYVWDNGVADNVPFIPSLGIVNYNVIGTDINGCVDTDQVTVTVYAQPIIDAGLDQVVCEGTSVTLSASGGLSYVWDNGIINGIPFFPGVGNLTYTVTGTDANGCIDTDIVDVFVNPLPVVNAGSDQVLCEGPSVVVSGSGALTYSWDNGVSNNVAFMPTIGTIIYTVTGMDGNGCVDTDVLSITVNPLPLIVATALDQDVCNGQSATLNGSGGNTYVWDNGVLDGLSFVPPFGITNYMVTGTDINGCENTDQITITVYALPIVVAGTDLEVCEGATVTLAGAGAQTYAWSNGIFNNVPFMQGVGTVNYTVVGTDANGCVASDMVQVIVNALPNVSGGGDIQNCEFSNTILVGSGASTYTWNNGITNNISFIPNVGTTTYTVIGVDDNGCENTDQVDVIVNGLPVVVAGLDQEVCQGTSVTLSGLGADSYIWSGGVIDNVAFIPAIGIEQYIVTGTDLNMCSNSDTVLVIVNSNPIVNAGADQTMCDGEQISLHATGTANLFWNNSVVNDVMFSPGVGTMTYIVTDSLITGCIDRDTLIVEVFPLPVVSASSMEICEGQGAILFGEGADSYVWSGGVLDGVYFYPETTASYTLVGTDLNGCKDSSSVQIVVNPSPRAYFTLSSASLSTSASTTTFNNLSVDAVSNQWEFSDFSADSYEFEPEHTFPSDQAGTYSITLNIISEFGCTDVFQRLIVVEQDYAIYVPNAFTPDGNGVNEMFNPVLTGFDEMEYTLFIFNRWGQLVFESHDMSVGWDGSYSLKRNDNVQDGAYTWKVFAKIKNSAERKQFVGHVALLK